ncbi:MAG TPA: hypothetical protein VH352_06810 [Pseudonocardiaceae bacterium]|nr:hypothetical protein [Pseudonocardiaceae bacterium]
MASAHARQVPASFLGSTTTTTLAFRPTGDAELVTWTHAGAAREPGMSPRQGIIAQIDRAGHRWLAAADMVVHPMRVDLSTAIMRARRILATLPKCAVAAVGIDAGCVACWCDDDRSPVDVVIMPEPAVAAPDHVAVSAAAAYSRIAMGRSPLTAGSWDVCATRAGRTHRLALRPIPLRTDDFC